MVRGKDGYLSISTELPSGHPNRGGRTVDQWLSGHDEMVLKLSGSQSKNIVCFTGFSQLTHFFLVGSPIGNAGLQQRAGPCINTGKIRYSVYSLLSTEILTCPFSPSRPVHTETISIP